MFFEKKTIYIEIDDDTYHYGDNNFECDYCKDTDIYLEPFILRKPEKNKVIKFYRSKKFFAVYKNDKLVKIIQLQTCWSDNYIKTKMNGNIAYSITQTVKAHYEKINEPCNIDFSEFIQKHNL